MPVLTSRPTGIFRITALKASVGPGNMKYCRVRLSLKVSHADAGSGRSCIRDNKKYITGIMLIMNTKPTGNDHIFIIFVLSIRQKMPNFVLSIRQN